jgi:GntR family transcriptional regulator/MocR family aminotransferase
MFPSIRLGYLVIPFDLIERFAAMRQVMDICPTHITQAVMSDFIREGHFARHVRRMRPIYAERRRVLVAELEHQLGNNVTIMGDQAGMHLAIFFARVRDDRKIAATAARQSLWLSALSSAYVGSTPRYGFVLGFGNTKVNDIPQAVRHLKKLICH